MIPIKHGIAVYFPVKILSIFSLLTRSLLSFGFTTVCSQRRSINRIAYLRLPHFGQPHVPSPSAVQYAQAYPTHSDQALTVLRSADPPRLPSLRQTYRQLCFFCMVFNQMNHCMDTSVDRTVMITFITEILTQRTLLVFAT